MSTSALFSFLLWSFLAVSQVPPDADRVTRLFDFEVDHEPELNTVAEAMPGETLYAESGYPVLPIAKLSGEARLNGTVWPKGKTLHGAMLGESKVFCDPDSLQSTSTHGLMASHSNMLQRFDQFVCLLDEDEDSYFDHFIDTATPERLHFERVRYTLDTLKAENVGMAAKVSRRVLFFESYSSGALRLQYTIAMDDSGAPAMSRSLEFDLQDEYPQDISFEEVRIELLDAAGNYIRYRVINGFQP
jgi:hypothetical protein